MKKTKTPFEIFQDLARAVTNIPKADVVKLEKKWKATRKTKKKKPKK